jgi:hypothetical protein
MIGRLPPRVIRALRAMYGPPLDPAYWDLLHRRVLASVAAERVAGRGGIGVFVSADPWGLAFRAWAGAGLVAAGIAALCVGAATWRSRAADVQVAYETVLTTPAAGGSVWLVDASGVSDGRSP